MDSRRSTRPRPRDGDHEHYRQCARLASEERDAARRIGHLLGYLQTFPLGRHNRRVTEQIEVLLDDLPDPRTRAHLTGRLRTLRDAIMEPLRPNSWAGPLLFRTRYWI